MNIKKEIEWLLREKYGSPLQELGKSGRAKAEKDIERLRRGEHVDYVIGFSNFLGLKIFLSEKPLIPRVETEYWTEKAISDIQSSISNEHRDVKVLDLFCGSGCIGLAILKEVPSAKVDFADIQPEYFRDIRKSARAASIEKNRFRTISSNMFRNIRGKYDLILANPPYIPSARKLPDAVLKNDPRNALFAGKDGLRFIRPLLKQAGSHLEEGGELWLEFDSPQKNKIGAISRQFGWGSRFLKDQFGRWRTAILRIS